MKTLIIALVASLSILSCTKENQQRVNEVPDYIGEYNSAKGDTAFVSQNGEFIKIEWNVKFRAQRWVFDSVRVHSDSTLTDNEYIRLEKAGIPYFEILSSVGSGKFGKNTLQFHFMVDGNRNAKFEGIKKD